MIGKKIFFSTEPDWFIQGPELPYHPSCTTNFILHKWGFQLRKRLPGGSRCTSLPACWFLSQYLPSNYCFVYNLIYFTIFSICIPVGRRKCSIKVVNEQEFLNTVGYSRHISLIGKFRKEISKVRNNRGRFWRKTKGWKRVKSWT